MEATAAAAEIVAVVAVTVMARVEGMAVAADKVREDEEMVVEVATVLVKAMAEAGREVAMEVVVMARRWGRRGRWQAWRLGEGGGTVAAAEMVVEEGRACELDHIRCEFCVFTVWARCHAFYARNSISTKELGTFSTTCT